MKVMFVTALVSATLTLSACGGSSSTGLSTEEPGQVSPFSVRFSAVFNGNNPINCDTELTGLGVAGTQARLEDFRFYVHDLVLTTSHGRKQALALDESDFQSGEVALLDFQDRADKCAGDAKATNDRIRGSVSLDDGEEVVGLRFTVGVPPELNHQNMAAADSPLNVASLFWSWQSGYKFMRLDIAPQDGVRRVSDPDYLNTAWNLHLGSTGCEGDPEVGEVVDCARSNRVTVHFPSFDADTQTIVLDYGTLIGAENLALDAGGPAGCMSGVADPECESIFQSLGLDFLSGEMVASPDITAFRLVTTADLD